MTDKTEKLVDGTSSVDPKHAPVAMPPAAFDMEKLVPALEKAHDASDRPDAVAAALREGAVDAKMLDGRQGAAMDGFSIVQVERPDLGVTENTLVADPAQPDENAEGATEASHATRRKAAASQE